MMEIRRRLAALLVLGWLSQALGDTSSAAAATSGMDSSSTSTSAELAPVTMMDSGSFHTVVIIRDSMVNVVKNWGANGKGQVRERERGKRARAFLQGTWVYGPYRAM